MAKLRSHVPGMASGASDSMWFRSRHVPSYGVSPTFIKPSDAFSHGLNERRPVSNIAPKANYYLARTASAGEVMGSDPK